MKVRVYYAVFDGGDGSATERRYKTAEERDEDVKEEEQEYDTFCLDKGVYIFDTDGYEVVE